MAVRVCEGTERITKHQWRLKVDFLVTAANATTVETVQLTGSLIGYTRKLVKVINSGENVKKTCKYFGKQAPLLRESEKLC